MRHRGNGDMPEGLVGTFREETVHIYGWCLV